jgi:hypothetical protein
MQATNDFDLAMSVCKDVTKAADLIFSNAQMKGDAHDVQLLVAQALRSRLFFNGIMITARGNLVAPSAALLRCLIEQQYVIEAVAKEPGRAKDLISADNRERKKALSRVLALPPESRAANINDALIKDKLSTLPALTKDRVTVAQWADRAGRLDEYELAYMWLSSAVHPSLRGAESHLTLGSENSILSMTASPDVSQLPFLLVTACNSFLCILWVLPESVRNQEATDLITALWTDERKQAIAQRELDALEK